MNKKILFVLALNWILVGCSQAPTAPDGGPLANCKPQAIKSCKKNDPQAPTVNLNTRNGKLEAKPYCVRAEEGTQLVFRLTPSGKNPLNTVEIIPKDPNHKWLEASNSILQDLIIIDIPSDLDDDDYYYGVKTNTHCIDPRIHIKR